MKDIKKKSINVLCSFGKFGLGKSITLGMYDFEVPASLMADISNESKNGNREKAVVSNEFA